ncbi:hypothetical protein V2O64_14535 [Verrucomicrobiaceae bacterium 227]
MEPTEEEWKLPLSELAWKYQRAGLFKDTLTMERINMRLEGLDRHELADFAQMVGSHFPSELQKLLSRMMPIRERLDFLIQVNTSDDRVRSLFSAFSPLPEAAEWLFEKGRENGLIVSLKNDYQTKLWEELRLRLKQPLGSRDEVTQEERRILLKSCIERSPEKFRDSFEEMMTNLNNEGGGE